MSTTRECRQRVSRVRQTNLIRSRQERAVHERRRNQQAVREVFNSLDHDRRMEEELLYGPEWEQENARDDTQRV